MKLLRTTAVSVVLLSVAAILAACVQDRPTRNGVFNENHYLRKSFLIRSGSDPSATDPGWIMQTTVTSVSTPNPLGGSGWPDGLSPGLSNGGDLVRFEVTEDHLQMISMRDLTTVASDQTTPEVENGWPATNVDIQYRVNLDGEITNFLEENQERDWQQRQWVKVSFSKQDMSDLYSLNPTLASLWGNCIDQSHVSTTMVPDTFLVDEANDYFQWTLQINLPINFTDPTCMTAYADLGIEAQDFGRSNVTVNLMYSFTRANPTPMANYAPLQVDEKDPIRHKYGFYDTYTMARDESTGQLATRSFATRYNPNGNNIVWYFARGFPAQYESVFSGAGGIGDQTNQILANVGATTRLMFKHYNDDLPEGTCTLPDADPNHQCPREYGDVRYNMLVWMTNRDVQGFFAGATEPTVDPRTGEVLSTSIVMNDFSIQDFYVQRIDAYLQTLGATAGVNTPSMWTQPCTSPTDPTPHVCNPNNPALPGYDAGDVPSGTCQDGDVVSLIPSVVAANHNGNSSLFQHMQTYLQRPAATYGNLGPQDFIVDHTQDNNDFYNAYFALLPYEIFRDPNTNFYVTPEGQQGVFGADDTLWPLMQQESQFQQAASQIDHGIAPYEDATGTQGVLNATSFINGFRSLTAQHLSYGYQRQFVAHAPAFDPPSAFSFEQIVQHDGRHCINGTWESRDQWIANLISTYWAQTMWHEFGHSLGLQHNFMSSVDMPNFPHYLDNSTAGPNGGGRDHIGLYASSVMEYNTSPDRIFWHAGWGPYDQGVIGFLYGNNQTPSGTLGPHGQASTTISGQATPTTPWNDRYGFASNPMGHACTADSQCSTSSGEFCVAGRCSAMPTERQYLYCNETDQQYTPLCRAGDSGVTPSEIIANQIDAYEWQYQWRNFRSYHPFWNDTAYADGPAGIVDDMKRFMSLWVFDWSTGELADTFRRIGVVNPNANGSDLQYYTALTNKFNADISAANQLVAAFHESIIQQSAGERPFATLYDPYYGDVIQQGIILDKLFAMQAWVGLWPAINYDPNQAGTYIASYEGLGDDSFNYVAQSALTSMVGGAYDVYPYFVPVAVSLFAQDSHSPSYAGQYEVRNWIGGQVFSRLQDFLDYFRDLAVQNNADGCLSVDVCSYDPRTISDTHNEFVGPDQRRWIWAYIQDRNQWVAVQRDYNTASYLIVRNYTDDVIFQMDDGNFPGGAFQAELPMKYFLDSFSLYN